MKKNIFLDLDQTLIASEYIEDFDLKKYKDKFSLFEFDQMDNSYIVFHRPHLQKFLDYIFKNYNVSVWTAASRSYAMFIIEHIILKKKNRKIDYILYSDHCKISKKSGPCPKNLKLIWEKFNLKGYTADNTIIIDDLDDVYKHQQKNCIPVIPFEVLDKDSHKDRELLKVIETLKEKFPV